MGMSKTEFHERLNKYSVERMEREAEIEALKAELAAAREALKASTEVRNRLLDDLEKTNNFTLSMELAAARAELAESKSFCDQGDRIMTNQQFEIQELRAEVERLRAEVHEARTDRLYWARFNTISSNSLEAELGQLRAELDDTKADNRRHKDAVLALTKRCEEARRILIEATRNRETGWFRDPYKWLEGKP